MLTARAVGYASALLPENLPAEDRDMKCAVYAATLAGVLALDHPCPGSTMTDSLSGAAAAGWRNANKALAGRQRFTMAMAAYEMLKPKFL